MFFEDEMQAVMMGEGTWFTSWSQANNVTGSWHVSWKQAKSYFINAL